MHFIFKLIIGGALTIASIIFCSKEAKQRKKWLDAHPNGGPFDRDEPIRDLGGYANFGD